LTEEPEQQQGTTVDLSPRERREAGRRSGLRAAVVFESVRREGELELQRTPAALAFSGFAAGLSMGMTLIAAGVIRAALPDTPWRVLLENVGYTVGFLVVILGRQQFFTENTVTVIIPLLDAFTPQKLWAVARLWLVVLLANIAGAAVFAFGLAHSGAFTPAAQRGFLDLGLHTLSFGFTTVFVKAIFAGWMIALIVWLLPAAENARVAVVFVLAYLVGISGLSHVVAGSAEALYAVAAGAASWQQFVRDFMVPAFLGNSIGGVFLVSLLNYAQVAVKSEEETQV
jgi:formate/nitrite transporter FocA (FNT family)